MTPVRTLVVADETAWPVDTGYRQRLHHVLRGLAEAGPVDWTTVEAGPGAAAEHPPGLVAHAHSVRAPWRAPAGGALRWLGSGQPRWLAGRNWTAARAVLRAQLVQSSYDLVWVSHLDVWAGLAPALAGQRVVVDVDNVLSVVSSRWAALGGARGRLHREEARRWRRVEVRAGRLATLVACTAADALRLGTAAVVPNGYEPTAPLPPWNPSGDDLLLVASFDYPPNVDAAVWFAHAVLPLVRERVPGATLRLVGRTSQAVTALAARPGVTVVGPVLEVGSELARAAAAVVPVRVGGGTRVKVLEAFCAGVPVVATPVGVEGVEAQPGRDLLVGASPEELAHACVQVLTDPALARSLAAAGQAVWQERYRWETVRPLVTELARTCAAAGHTPITRSLRLHGGRRG